MKKLLKRFMSFTFQNRYYQRGLRRGRELERARMILVLRNTMPDEQRRIARQMVKLLEHWPI